MEELNKCLIEFAWVANIFAIVLTLIWRRSKNTKLSWAIVGLILLVIAFGNAQILITTGGALDHSQSMASLFGVAILGPLGLRFIGNWLTEGAL